MPTADRKAASSASSRCFVFTGSWADWIFLFQLPRLFPFFLFGLFLAAPPQATDDDKGRQGRRDDGFQGVRDAEPHIEFGSACEQ